LLAWLALAHSADPLTTTIQPLDRDDTTLLLTVDTRSLGSHCHQRRRRPRGESGDRLDKQAISPLVELPGLTLTA